MTTGKSTAHALQQVFTMVTQAVNLAHGRSVLKEDPFVRVDVKGVLDNDMSFELKLWRRAY